MNKKCNVRAKMLDPEGLSSSGSPPYCLRVLGRKPTISIASCSRSKSCLRSSPSTVKQSCWCQVDREKRRRRQRKGQHQGAGKCDLLEPNSRHVLQPAGASVCFGGLLHSVIVKVLKSSSESRPSQKYSFQLEGCCEGPGPSIFSGMC